MVSSHVCGKPLKDFINKIPARIPCKIHLK